MPVKPPSSAGVGGRRPGRFDVQCLADVSDPGVTEHFPESDEEREAVWAAALTLTESGNLMMMAPRAVDDGEWMRLSTTMVDIGVDAAEAKSPEAVLAVGERVYHCHNRYVVDAVD